VLLPLWPIEPVLPLWPVEPLLLPLWPIEPLLPAVGLWLSELAVDGGPWLSDDAVVPLAPELPALAVPAPVVDESDGPPAIGGALLLLLEPGSLLAVRVSLLRCAQAPSPIRLVAASAIPR
jgi:hypothetical protein